jgi:hypothetical protein
MACRSLALLVAVALVAVVGAHAFQQEKHASLAWSQLQQTRYDRLRARLVALIADPSNLGGLGVEDQQQQGYNTLLGLSGLQLDANLMRRRQLQQLAGSVRDTRLDPSKGQLVSTTSHDARVTDPEGTYQVVSSQASSVGIPFDSAAFNRLASFSPGIASAAAALQDLGVSTEGFPAAQAGDAGSAAVVQPAVGATDRAAQQQQQQSQRQQVPLQPSLRIVGGVEAPTDRCGCHHCLC